MENGRQPEFMGNGGRPQILENGKRPQFLENGRRHKKFQIEDDLKDLKQYHFENRRRS